MQAEPFTRRLLSDFVMTIRKSLLLPMALQYKLNAASAAAIMCSLILPERGSGSCPVLHPNVLLLSLLLFSSH